MDYKETSLLGFLSPVFIEKATILCSLRRLKKIKLTKSE
jgi:hypothetical protein